MRRITSLVLLAIAIGTAACSGSPTSSAADVGPRFDGGVFGGSGNFVETPPPPAENTTATGTEVTAADSVTTGRGGVFGGSGN